MNQTRLQKTRNILLNLIIICLGIYFFIVLLPLPSSIDIGLASWDSWTYTLWDSWTYTLFQSAQNGLIFGEDIVFTYGPLGYLIEGTPVKTNFFLITIFRLIVYLSLYVIAVIKILNSKTKYQKFLLTFSLLLASIFISTEYHLVLIFILLLSFGELIKKSISFWSVGLGAFAGFCLLIKFNIGIITFGSLILFFLGNLYTSLREKSNRTNSIFALLNSLVTAVSISFILLSPNYYLVSLTKIIIGLGLSTLVSAIFYVIQHQRNFQKTKYHRNEISTEMALLNLLKVKLFSWWIFYLVYSACLIGIILYSYPSWLEYITNSLEISLGYSSGMSEVGADAVVWIAISKILLTSSLIILLIKEGNVGFALAISFVLYLGFKHGHIRQDFRFLVFVSLILFLVPICLIKLKKKNFIKWAYFVNIYVLTILLLYINLEPTIFFKKVQIDNPISSLHRSTLEEVEDAKEDYNIISWIHPNIFTTQLTSLFNFSSFKAKILSDNDATLALFKLPTNIKTFLKDSSIDSIPGDNLIMPANQLNWKPRPILHSYAAYTTKLDKINSESLSKEPRDYLLYRFDTIDKRHPFFDEPKTFTYIFCNYHPSNKFPNFISPTDAKMKDYKYLLLEKATLSQCLPNLGDSKLSVPWGKPISINPRQDNSLITADIQLRYSILGKLYKTLYRIPPVIMQVNYQDKTEAQYRILPENSQGVIVSNLPRSNEETLAFFRGELPTQVESFSFNVNPPWLFQPTIEIKFSPVLLNKRLEQSSS
ncbi:MAG: hypothetical protein RMX35_15190 [Nostoc sp. DcaGUA01]|nr:hypothetical protein [Nostoc sp. DcaGUA01]